MLRHPSQPKVLLLRSDRAWRLPRAVVADQVWLANAKVIVPAFEARLGTRPWLLRGLAGATDEQAKRISVVAELEVADPVWAAPAHGRWVGLGELERLRLADEPHRELLTGYLDDMERGEVPAQRAPWARTGWLPAVRRWIEGEAGRLGLVVLGVEQVKHWSISSVLRISTDGPDLYFKVPLRLPLFVEEAVVTSRLADRFPAYVPKPLAVEPHEGWMLLAEFDELLGWSAPLEARQEALRRFAGLQVRTAELVDGLLADGCLDRRLEVLEGQIGPLLDDPRAVRRLEAHELAELRRLVPVLQRTCRRLAECGLPATLVHGDLHADNVARIDGELQYYDWTDACVAHPFIDLLSLQWERDETNRAALLEAFLEPWQEVAPRERLQEAAELAAVVIPLHHAVSYATIVNGLEPSGQGELDATHAFLREALARATAPGAA